MFEKLRGVNESELIQLRIDFEKIMTKHSFLKKHLIHEEGAICNHLYLIEKGVIRSFYHKDGKDITAHFALDRDAITAIDSFIQRKHSRYNIEVLEDAEVWLIDHQDMLELLTRKPQYERYIRLFLEQVYVDLVERVEGLLFFTAKERYNQLIEKNPDLLQRVNSNHIASFIGITQETLSRIRVQG